MKIEQLMETFGTQKKCDKYRRNLQKVNDNINELLRWKVSSGCVIRESKTHDNIGTSKLFATIHLCDMIGCDGYNPKSHTYEFAVFMHCNGIKENYRKFSSLKDAVNDYRNMCTLIHQIEREKFIGKEKKASLEIEALEDF